MKLLLNLRHVPDDEADEVRTLLEQHEIAFYETKPSVWGVSAGGIWIRRDEDVATAARLMGEYQQQRRANARAEYAAAKQAGRAGPWRVFREHPLHAIVALLAIAFVLALSALPFVMLG